MGAAKRERGATDSRERILDSAARVFAAYGFRHATFEEIAAGAGVSRTLLYRHFDGKTDLLRAVRERALRAWADSVASGARECATARGVLEATIRETLRFAGARADFRAFLAGDTRLALLGEDAGGGLSRQLWRESTSALLARGVSAGEFPADLDIPATADVLCAMQLGVIEQMHQVDDVSLGLRARPPRGGGPHPGRRDRRPADAPPRWVPGHDHGRVHRAREPGGGHGPTDHRRGGTHHPLGPHPSSLDPFRAGPGRHRPDALGRQSDVVGICVTDDEAVREVVLGPTGVLAGMAAGSVLAIHSTIGTATCVEIAGAHGVGSPSSMPRSVAGGAAAAAARSPSTSADLEARSRGPVRCSTPTAIPCSTWEAWGAACAPS